MFLPFASAIFDLHGNMTEIWKNITALKCLHFMAPVFRVSRFPEGVVGRNAITERCCVLMDDSF